MDTFQKPKSGRAQLQTVTKWHAYLSQHSTLSTSPLSAKLHAILDPVIYVTAEPTSLMEIADTPEIPSSVKEGTGPIPMKAWYTDGSAPGNPC